MENRKDTENLNLVLSLLALPEIVEKASGLGVKITQNSKSITLRIEKGSVAWGDFTRGCLLALKKKDVKKQVQQLRGLLHREGLALRSGVAKEGRTWRSALAKMIKEASDA